MEIRGSGELEQDIARLEEQREQAILAERAEYERQLQAEKEAKAEELRREEEASKRRAAELVERRRLDTQRDLEWPATVRERCFSPAINPLFKSWGLCESFVRCLNDDELQPSDVFCGQCSAGWMTPHFQAGLVHRQKAGQPT